MNAYYQFLHRQVNDDASVTASYRSTIHSQGAWSEAEQHMAVATGVITAELEQFNPRPEMQWGRISLDILGMIHFGEFTITTRVIRPGKTIELVESIMASNGRPCIEACAWRILKHDTDFIAGIEDQNIGHPAELPDWVGMKHWPGGYIASLQVTAHPDRRAGKGIVWLNTPIEMVEGQETSDFVHIIGLIDTANGIVPRRGSDRSWGYPNLDLQIHLHRIPQGRWLGLETTQQYGSSGIGLTSSILHDVHGPFGHSEQILTVRPLS